MLSFYSPVGTILSFPCFCMIAFHCCCLPCYSIICFVYAIKWIAFLTDLLMFLFHFGMLLSFLFGHALVFFIHPLVLLFVFSLFLYDCISLWFFPLGHAAVFFIHPLFLLLFVICFFVYDCVLLWFLYSVICWACCCLSSSSMVHFIYLIKRVAFHCVFVLGFSFGHAVVFFIPLWFILFTQSNELHFVAVFVVCFVSFWVSSCLPSSSTVPFIY